jgi:Rha family phage regulatory protein
MELTPSIQSAIVHLSKGKPVTDSLAIAREFGRPHKNVMQSIDALIASDTISRLEFKPRDYVDDRGKTQRMIELTERGALIAMPFIGGKKSRQGQVVLVDGFLKLREELLRHSDTWLEARNSASASFLAVMDALHAMRTEAGKLTQARNYMNESKMMNKIVFGVAGKVDRSRRSTAEIKLLDSIERKNAYLIARGYDYFERKDLLRKYTDILLAGAGLKSPLVLQ